MTSKSVVWSCYQAPAGKWLGLTCFPVRHLLIPAVM